MNRFEGFYKAHAGETLINLSSIVIQWMYKVWLPLKSNRIAKSTGCAIQTRKAPEPH